jgi:hypothetical protein
MFVATKNSGKTEPDVCCPPFDPAKWHHVHHSWKDRPFLRDSVPELFHIPLPGTYAKAIARMWKKASDTGAAPEPDDFLLLANDPSSFRADLYMSLSKDIPDAETVKLAGNFFSQVFEASYGDVRKCLRETSQFLAKNGMFSLKDYIYYPYCPKCAKKYGHNYVVVLSKVARLQATVER